MFWMRPCQTLCSSCIPNCVPRLCRRIQCIPRRKKRCCIIPFHAFHPRYLSNPVFMIWPEVGIEFWRCTPNISAHGFDEGHPMGCVWVLPWGAKVYEKIYDALTVVQFCRKSTICHPHQRRHAPQTHHPRYLSKLAFTLLIPTFLPCTSRLP